MTIDADVKVTVPRRRFGTRVIVGACIAAGIVGLAAANAHLVYVSVISQPDCMVHAKQSGADAAGTVYRAARSSC